MGVGWSRWQFLHDACCPSKHTFLAGAVFIPTAASLRASFSALNAFSFAKVFPWAFEVALFLGFCVAFAFVCVAAKTPSEPGDEEPCLLSSTVVASSSSSVEEDGTLMGTIACTWMMPRGGLLGLTISLLRVWDWCRVFERLRSSTGGPASQLPFPFCDPCFFVHGLSDAVGNSLSFFPSGVLDARVFSPSSFVWCWVASWACFKFDIIASVRALTFEFSTDNSCRRAAKSTPRDSLSILFSSSASRRVVTLADQFCTKWFQS